MDLTPFIELAPRMGLVAALLIAVYFLWNGYQGVLRDYIAQLKSDAATKDGKPPVST